MLTIVYYREVHGKWKEIASETGIEESFVIDGNYTGFLQDFFESYHDSAGWKPGVYIAHVYQENADGSLNGPITVDEFDV